MTYKVMDHMILQKDDYYSFADNQNYRIIN
jgi:DNA repair protein RadC